MTAQAPLTFSAAIGSPLWRAGLAREVARETAFALDFIEISPIFRAFAPMVREQRFDVSEMAIATALQDIAYGSKLMVLPVTLVSRFQHQCLITRNTPAPLRPADLAGRRVGVRAYSQTTGVWVRGILENDFGVPASSITWVTQEGAHLAQYENPAWVIQQDDPRSLVDMLRDGEIDAAILGNDLPEDASLTTVIANPQAAAQDWYARHRVIPTNHVMVVRQDLADAHPEAIRALWRCIRRAKPQPSGGFDFAAVGIEANRPPVEMLLQFCAQQALLPRSLTVDDIYAPARELLGADAL